MADSSTTNVDATATTLTTAEEAQAAAAPAPDGNSGDIDNFSVDGLIDNNQFKALLEESKKESEPEAATQPSPEGDASAKPDAESTKQDESKEEVNTDEPNFEGVLELDTPEEEEVAEENPETFNASDWFGKAATELESTLDGIVPDEHKEVVKQKLAGFQKQFGRAKSQIEALSDYTQFGIDFFNQTRESAQSAVEALKPVLSAIRQQHGEAFVEAIEDSGDGWLGSILDNYDREELTTLREKASELDALKAQNETLASEIETMKSTYVPKRELGEVDFASASVKIANSLAQTNTGFEVTEALVKNAERMFPEMFRDKPVSAFCYANFDAMMKHSFKRGLEKAQSEAAASGVKIPSAGSQKSSVGKVTLSMEDISNPDRIAEVVSAINQP